MNLRQLEIFLAIAKSGSFSRAAEEVLLTQSTVSQHIAALENEMGVRLFDRLGRGAELTEGGQLLRRHALQVLAECADLREAMASFRGMENPQLIVGASNVPANYLIPSILPTLVARHPGVVLNVLSGDSRETIDRLRAGVVALGIVGDHCDCDDLDFEPLVADVLPLVVGRGHPWEGRQDVTLEELLAEPLVVREGGSGSGRSTEDALRRAGIDPTRLHIVAHLGSNEAIKQAVIAGFGVAFLSVFSIHRELNHGELTAVSVAGLKIERCFWLVMRRERTLSPAAAAFATLLSEYFAGRTNGLCAPQGGPTTGRCT